MRLETLLRAVPLLILALLFPGRLAGASTAGQVAYVEGQNSFIAGDYAAVAAKMRIAIQNDPAEGIEKFKSPNGRNKVDYTPHLYLGLALEKLNQPEEARRALLESRRQGAGERSAMKSALDRALGRLEARLAPPTATAAPPTAVAVMKKEEPTATSSTTAVGRPPQPTAALVIPTRVAVMAPSLPSLFPTATPAAGRAAVVASGPDPSREALRSGIRSYLAGRYLEAFTTLEPLHKKNASARLFLAYALASMYFASTPPDASMKDRALTEFSAARAAGADPLPGHLLAPKIRDLLGIR